jgi:uncharacterized membrane protein
MALSVLAFIIIISIIRDKITLRSKIFRFFLGVMLMLVISGLLAFNALLLWVATGTALACGHYPLY